MIGSDTIIIILPSTNGTLIQREQRLHSIATIPTHLDTVSVVQMPQLLGTPSEEPTVLPAVFG